MKWMLCVVTVLALVACEKKDAPVPPAKPVSVRPLNSRYILISNVTSPGAGCTETATLGVWSCPAP